MGAYLTIIAGIVKFANYISASLQEHHDELNGANQQKVADAIAQKQILDQLTAPVGSAESELLWKQNKAKFGPAE